MGKRNTKGTKAKNTARSPIRSRARQTTTYEGGTGYRRDALSELFLLGVTNFGSEDTFYERGDKRDSRYAKLIHKIAPENPAWLVGFLPWLRDEAHMRTAAVDGVVESVHAMKEAGVNGGRVLASRVPGRSDEPGAIMATWYERYGRQLPKPLKRGLADACDRLYTEYALLNYDTDRYEIRFGDVIEQCRPVGSAGSSYGALYRYAIDRRHGRHAIPGYKGDPKADFPPLEIPHQLSMCIANAKLRRDFEEDPRVLLRTGRLREAGMDWRNALSLAGDKLDKAKLWTALAPVMGYQALLMNLRNFDQAGMSDEAASLVAARLCKPELVARSHQFPMAFLAAYREAPSLRWAHPLDKALTLSLSNVPKLRGRSLILIDTSRSMNNTFSAMSSLRRWDAAVIFGAGIGQRCASADVISFSGRSFYYEQPTAVTRAFPLKPGESLLKTLERFRADGYFIDQGTDTALALRAHYAGHDRAIIITDEQSGEDPREISASIPAHVPMYTFNLAGYKAGHAPSGGDNRHAFGGLTDAMFSAIPLLEAGRDQAWPFVVPDLTDLRDEQPWMGAVTAKPDSRP